MQRNHLKFFKKNPSLENAASQLCTASQILEDVYSFWLKEIGQERKFHRKQWEYVYILQILRQFNLLRKNVRGLGFGCGKEPLPAVMAKYGCDVMATDIAPLEKGDEYWGARSAVDIFSPGVCPMDIFLERVSFESLDMNDIPQKHFDSYDYLWSSCALEHLGSRKAGLDFIVESSKCLRPGGIAVHTTELNTSSRGEAFESPGLSLYQKSDIKLLQKELKKAGCSLLPVNWDQGNLLEDNHVDLPPYEEKTHLKLLIENYVVTSLGLVLIRH